MTLISCPSEIGQSRIIPSYSPQLGNSDYLLTLPLFKVDVESGAPLIGTDCAVVKSPNRDLTFLYRYPKTEKIYISGAWFLNPLSNLYDVADIFMLDGDAAVAKTDSRPAFVVVGPNTICVVHKANSSSDLYYLCWTYY
jgi:hypothetical protein